jgi:membrane-associated protease RseP (regulator of RpoE activity)
MDFQTASAIVFVILLSVFLYIQRKKVTMQKILFPLFYFLMYRGRFGLKFMERSAARHGRLLRILGFVGIVIGFLGMVGIAIVLVQNMIKILTVPETISGVQLVLPVKVKGSFYVPFFYWILSIVVIAVVHEFSHGVIAKAHKMRIKSSGFAFLGILLPILPAAFVEPNEKELVKRPKRQQLAVYAAGPFANILFGLAALVVLLLIAGPVTGLFFEDRGVEITGLVTGKIVYPAQAANMTAGDVITGIDNKPITSTDSFVTALKSKRPGDFIEVTTNRSSYTVTLAKNPYNASLPYLGVYVQQKTSLKPSAIRSVGKLVPYIVVWFLGLIYWLYLLSLGIGLFNLVPLGPLDGGRMLLAALQKFYQKEKAARYWRLISMFFLALIVTNLVFSFL